MGEMRFSSRIEQLAAHLGAELLRGRWGTEMPGRLELAREMGTNHKLVDAALRLLETQGLLVAQGAGRRRKIVRPDNLAQASLRIAILPGRAEDVREHYLVDLRHELVEAGHVPFHAEKSLRDLRMDVNRAARMVGRTVADAWVVVGGSRAVLEWFHGQEIPVFALFGRRRDLPIAGAGPDKANAYREVVRHLVALGHRRIVLLALSARRLPEPGQPERAFLSELEAHGIPTGTYNLPDWDECPEGLQRLMDSLIEISPPTALLIDEAYLFHAVKHHLSARGLRIPEDVSLICTDPDRTFEWHLPSVAHIRWDSDPLVRRIVRWAENVACGREDRRQVPTAAELVAGGTVGPVKSGGRRR